ncbi:hypothetical protein B2J88_08000 [Rhodococcus sp. SRB_17]|nr:hypothetical protein [Rhodococcus sp. SRB_17]
MDVLEDAVALFEEEVDLVGVACASCLFEVPFVLFELVFEGCHQRIHMRMSAQMMRQVSIIEASCELSTQS